MSSFRSNTQSPKFFRVVITLSLLVLSSVLVGNVCAADVTLAWDENLDPDVEITGYRVYYGTDGQTFLNQGCDVTAATCSVSGRSCPRLVLSFTSYPFGIMVPVKEPCWAYMNAEWPTARLQMDDPPRPLGYPRRLRQMAASNLKLNDDGANEATRLSGRNYASPLS